MPTFNEAENIEAIVAAIRSVLLETAPEGFRIVVVDDGSPDGTGRLADRLAAGHEEVEVIHRKRREGLGPAYLAGFERALAGGAAYVIEMDADFSHDRRTCRGCWARCATATPTWRWARATCRGRGDGVDALRRAVSRGGSWYARLVLGVGIRDLTGGFKCFRREVLEGIDLPTVRTKGYGFQVELTYRALMAGYRVVELPIVFRRPALGRKSKMSPRIAGEAIWLMPRWLPPAARRRPRRLDGVGVRTCAALQRSGGVPAASSDADGDTVEAGAQPRGHEPVAAGRDARRADAGALLVHPSCGGPPPATATARAVGRTTAASTRSSPLDKPASTTRRSRTQRVRVQAALVTVDHGGDGVGRHGHRSGVGALADDGRHGVGRRGCRPSWSA